MRPEKSSLWAPSRMGTSGDSALLDDRRWGKVLKKVPISHGTAPWADRVILGAGDRVDISRCRIVDQSLSQRVERTTEGYPVLTTGLETSVKGLYMVGVVAEKTLGPALRFVAGTWNAGPRATRAIVERERVHFNEQYESASRQFPT